MSSHSLTMRGESNTSKQEGQLLDEIVATCQHRLLSRLRSQHAPRSKKITKTYNAAQLEGDSKLLCKSLGF